MGLWVWSVIARFRVCVCVSGSFFVFVDVHVSADAHVSDPWEIWRL